MFYINIKEQRDIDISNKCEVIFSNINTLVYNLDEQNFFENLDTCFVDINNDFTLYQISGEIFCYDISGTTLNGGFYQAPFRIESTNKENLTHRLENGISFSFQLKKGERIGCDKPLLNEINPDNKGFFFYYGLKSTDPFCGRIIPTTGCTSGITEDTFTTEIINPELDYSSFLYYTKQSYCRGELIETIHRYQDCENDITNNALGVRLTDEGSFNIRYFTTTGSCIDEKYISDVVLIDEYSDIIITDNEWHNIVLSFYYNEPINCFSDDKFYKMKLDIFVDGKLKYTTIVPELYSKPLNSTIERQLNIPHNISLGGGTVGNYENLFSGRTENDVEYCNYSFCFNNSLGEIEFITQGEEIILNSGMTVLAFLEDNFSNIDIQIFNENLNIECIYYTVNIKSKNEIKFIQFEEKLIVPDKKDCFNVLFNEGSNILGQTFGGTFEGEMCTVQIFDNVLLYQDICTVYEEFKITKGLVTNSC